MSTDQKIMIVVSLVFVALSVFASIRASFLIDKALGWICVAALSAWLAHAAISVVKDNRDKREREVEQTKQEGTK